MKNPHTKFAMNWFMVARDMAAWIPNEPHWNKCKLAWFITVWNRANLHWFQWGYLGIHAIISQAPMNRFPPNLGCGCFSSCSTDTWYPKCWNAKKSFLWCHHFCTLWSDESAQMKVYNLYDFKLAVISMCSLPHAPSKLSHKPNAHVQMKCTDMRAQYIQLWWNCTANLISYRL